MLSMCIRVMLTQPLHDKGCTVNVAAAVVSLAGTVCRYTVLFAVARTVGWVAQWKEMAEEPISKISRPRQV